MSASAPRQPSDAGPPDDFGLAQIHALQRMAEDISGELEMYPLLTRMVEWACRLTRADDGVIALYDPGHDVMRTEAIHRMPEAELGAVMRRGEGLAGQVLAHAAPVRCHYGELPRPSSGEPGSNHVIGMPICQDGAVIGAFCVGVRAPRTLDPVQERTLEAMARYAAVAIGNARRYAEQKHRAALFALIARIAGVVASRVEIGTLLQHAADAIHETLGFDRVDIPLLDADLRPPLARGAAGHPAAPAAFLPQAGIVRAAVLEKRSILAHDGGHDLAGAVRSRLAVPILDHDRALGAIDVEGPAPFDELDRISLEAIARYLAMAINDARLREHARQLAVVEERQRLARELHDNVTQIISSISLLAQSMESAWQAAPREGIQRALRIGELAQMAFAEMRTLLEKLQPPAREAGQRPMREGSPRHEASLECAVRRLVTAMVPGNIGLSIDFSRYRAQSLQAEEALLRICQESVSNSVRHARATGIAIAAYALPATTVLTVDDDGCGICPALPAGMGLSSMQQRMDALGGRLEISPRLPRGTRIKAELPRSDIDPACP